MCEALKELMAEEFQEQEELVTKRVTEEVTKRVTEQVTEQVTEEFIRTSLSSKVCKFFDFLSAVKLDRRFCIIFVDSHIIGRASHRLLHQSSERWIYQNKSRLFR